MRKLLTDGAFIRYVEGETIIGKVKECTGAFYNKKVSSRKPFGLATNVKPLPSGDILLKYNKGKGPYDSQLITTGREMIPQWKVIISRLTAEHAGQTDKEGRKKILSSLAICPPERFAQRPIW